MSTKKNKAVIQKYIEERNKGNLNAVREMHTPDYVRHWHSGVKNIDEVLEGLSKRSTSAKSTIDEMIANGDRVAAWGTGKKEGENDQHWCLVFRLSGGKIAESWNKITPYSGRGPYPE